jgi:tRNA modification GTPase
LHYGWIIDKLKADSRRLKARNGVVDEVLVSVMKGPFSYTREDVVEIYSHSGQVVVSKILDLILKKGARLSEPGEFTKRAFLSGRIDLIQAEAVRDIVEARTEKSLSLSLSQLKGSLSKELSDIQESLKGICAELEAQISFPEDVASQRGRTRKAIKSIRQKIEGLLDNAEEGRFLREGVACVICGKANAGKSSLLNMLLKQERVIVASLPGTTRDVVEDNINIKGMPLKIYDTAGILEPKDLIAAKAIQRSYAKIDQADLVLLIFDSSKPLSKDDIFLIEKARQKKVIFVINKIDLRQRIDIKRLSKYKKPMPKVSALHNKGLKGLEDAIISSVLKEGLHKNRDILVSNIRQIDLLGQALASLDQAKDYFSRRYSLDFIFFSLSEALEKVSRISGKDLNEDILDSIFSNFCIGK